MTTAVRKAGIFVGHFIVLVVGCVLIGLPLVWLQTKGLPPEVAALWGLFAGMPWGVFIFTRAADKLDGVR